VRELLHVGQHREEQLPRTGHEFANAIRIALEELPEAWAHRGSRRGSSRARERMAATLSRRSEPAARGLCLQGTREEDPEVRRTDRGRQAARESTTCLGRPSSWAIGGGCEGDTGKMKAAYLMKHGGPEVMQYGDLPDPEAQAGEVLVDVHAASVNGADWQVR